MGAISGTRRERQMGLVGMRVDERTLAADQLRQFTDGLGLPVLGLLRPTQNYVHLAARGLTLVRRRRPAAWRATWSSGRASASGSISPEWDAVRCAADSAGARAALDFAAHEQDL
jgi:hypothetical protein